MDKNFDIANERKDEQWTRLIHTPLLDFERRQSGSPTIIIVVDALDECNNQDDVETLLGLVKRTKDLSKVKVLITSRPESFIQRVFDEISEDEDIIYNLALQKIDDVTVGHDISVFIKHEMKNIRK